MNGIVLKLALISTMEVLALLTAAQVPQEPEQLDVDVDASSVTIHVARSGLLAFAGHEHRIVAPVLQGNVTLDRSDLSRSSVWIEFDAMAFTVVEEGEPPEDVPEVQRVMLSERVLDVERYPTIRFQSREISVVERSSEDLVLRVVGDLTLHGTTRRVSVPLNVTLAAGSLHANSTTTVKQSDFGIRPVTAGLGTVRVDDDVEVIFSIDARGR